MSKNVSEFTQFLNDFGIRAFDQLAARRAETGPPAGDASASDDASPLDRLAAHWSSLEPGGKQEFFDRLLLAGSAVAVAAPVIARALRAKKARTASRRKAAGARAPLGDASPEEPKEKPGAAKSDKKKDDQARKEKKKQKKLMKDAKKKEKKQKKKDKKKAR